MAGAATLRIAEASDADAIRTLTREAYAKWVPVTGREPLPMRVDYAEAVKTHRFDLLYADGHLAALIETVPDGEAMLIVNVAVATDMQRRGFGTLLLACGRTGHVCRLEANAALHQQALHRKRSPL